MLLFLLFVLKNLRFTQNASVYNVLFCCFEQNKCDMTSYEGALTLFHSIKVTSASRSASARRRDHVRTAWQVNVRWRWRFEVGRSYHHDDRLDGVGPAVPRVPHHAVVRHGFERPVVVVTVQVTCVTPVRGKSQNSQLTRSANSSCFNRTLLQLKGQSTERLHVYPDSSAAETKSFMIEAPKTSREKLSSMNPAGFNFKG